MFTAVPKSTVGFIKLIDAIASMLDIGTFKASSTGITLNAMDPTHVAFINIKLPETYFTEYQCDEPTPLRINFNDLSQFTKRGKVGDIIRLGFVPEKKKMRIQFKRKRSTRTFSIGLIAEDDDETDVVPNITYNSKATFALPPEELDRAIKDAQIVGDYVTFTALEEKLLLEAEGDSGGVEVVLEDFGDPPKIEGSQQAVYSIEFLTDIMKGTGMADLVTITFGSEMPIQFDCELDGSSKFHYILAPKVEESDDYAEDDDDLEDGDGAESD